MLLRPWPDLDLLAGARLRAHRGQGGVVPIHALLEVVQFRALLVDLLLKIPALGAVTARRKLLLEVVDPVLGALGQVLHIPVVVLQLLLGPRRRRRLDAVSRFGAHLRQLGIVPVNALLEAVQLRALLVDLFLEIAPFSAVVAVGHLLLQVVDPVLRIVREVLHVVVVVLQLARGVAARRPRLLRFGRHLFGRRASRRECGRSRRGRRRRGRFRGRGRLLEFAAAQAPVIPLQTLLLLVADPLSRLNILFAAAVLLELVDIFVVLPDPVGALVAIGQEIVLGRQDGHRRRRCRRGRVLVGPAFDFRLGRGALLRCPRVTKLFEESVQLPAVVAALGRGIVHLPDAPRVVALRVKPLQGAAHVRLRIARDLLDDLVLRLVLDPVADAAKRVRQRRRAGLLRRSDRRQAGGGCRVHQSLLIRGRDIEVRLRSGVRTRRRGALRARGPGRIDLPAPRSDVLVDVTRKIIPARQAGDLLVDGLGRLLPERALGHARDAVQLVVLGVHLRDALLDLRGSVGIVHVAGEAQLFDLALQVADAGGTAAHVLVHKLVHRAALGRVVGALVPRRRFLDRVRERSKPRELAADVRCGIVCAARVVGLLAGRRRARFLLGDGTVNRIVDHFMGHFVSHPHVRAAQRGGLPLLPLLHPDLLFGRDVAAHLVHARNAGAFHQGLARIAHREIPVLVNYIAGLFRAGFAKLAGDGHAADYFVRHV